ncbi:basement membrane-specific heparan sulfate proteoglycan core protein-like [Sander vitreus]
MGDEVFISKNLLSLIVFPDVLCVTVIQGQHNWGVTYTSTQICAVKGSTVEIHCSYTYPSTINQHVTKVEKRFWFTKTSNNAPVDLKRDSKYKGRVEYFFHDDDCTLRITDLRERDSVKYNCRFITNHGGFTGSPGVTLSVTDLQVKVTRSSTQAELRCHSSCNISDNPSYVWFNNGQKIYGETSSSLRVSVEDNNSYSCAVTGYEDYRSPSVYAPKLPSVSVSPSAEIVEGSSVKLTCSSDANPAAKYTWYKENVYKPLSEEPHLVFSSIRSSDSGQYYCTAENKLGMKTSQYKFIDVKLIQSQNGWGVTYTSTKICAVKGSTVEIHCSYTYPSTIVDGVKEKFWFTKESNNVYVDLTTDPEYSGRVQYQCTNKDCTLTISDLRERDSAVYYFRFITNHSTGKYTASPGVTLSVTGLQVQVSGIYKSSYRPELKCQSSCPLPGHPSYVWYKNGRNIQGQTSDSYSAYVYPADSFSCAVRGHEKSRSPSVSMRGERGWGVTYTSTKMCALKGSKVEIRCSYRYPSTSVKEKFWFTKESNNIYVDLTTDPEYSGRVQYHSENNNSTLTISDLRERDSAEYKFRFTTNQEGGRYTGLPGVTLSVADPQLQVHVRRSTVTSYQQPTWIELTCHNKCQLPDHYSYIWYKNGQKLEDKKDYFHLDLFNPADSYSCAVSGYKMFPSPSVYAPKLPSVSVSPSGDLMEGSSVNVTCNSDANPAANYTWYKKNLVPNPVLERLSEEPQLVFSSIRSSDSGQYYCTAENKLGRRTSANISINVKYGPKRSSVSVNGPKLPSVSVSPSAEIVEGSSVTLTCSSDANPAANYTWYKENEDSPKASGQIFTITDIRAEHK